MIEPPPLPREHGAWVLLAIPLLLGLAIGFRQPAAWLVVLAVVALFLAHFALVPALARVRTGKAAPAAWHRRRWTWGSAYALSSALAFASALVLAPRGTRSTVAALALACAAGAGVYFAASVFDRGRTLASELIGMAGMALSAALVAGAGGGLDVRAWSVAALAYAYALSSIAFVRAYASRKALACFAAQAAIASCLVLLWRLGWISLWTLVAFAPAAARAVIGFSRPPMNLRAVGRRELLVALSLVTIALLALASAP
jgi:YwiC-like protein